MMKMKPESGLQRRNSTGGAALIFSEPIPIPNYMRASIGSCHDLCKYGSRRDSSLTLTTNPKSKTGKNASSATKSPLPKKHHNQTSKSTTSLPRKSSSLLESSVSRTRRSKSVPKKVPKSQPGKLLETSESCQKSDQTVAEKIIHVVETNDRGNQNQNEDVEDQNQKMDSAARKLELKRGEVVEAEKREGAEISWKGIRLRRVVSEGDSEHKKEEFVRIVEMGKNKVKALVDTFETLMSTPDSRAISSSST